MLRTLIIATTFALISSCNESKKRALPIKIEERKEPHSLADIIFNFKAQQTTEFSPIKIYGTLLNNSADTVYFLSSSCDGKIYSLQYDTAKFKLIPTESCVADFPTIEKILPKGKIDLVAHFLNKHNYDEIKLGFDFYEVDKSFDKTKIDRPSIFNRGNDEKNMIWAEVQNLK